MMIGGLLVGFLYLMVNAISRWLGTMNANYEAGIAREVISKRARGESKREIMRTLQVTIEFVDKVLSEKHKHVVSRETHVSYDGISKVGGY